MMACGGGGGGGGNYSSPEALVSSMMKAISSGSGANCSSLIVTPSVMDAAVDCPESAKNEMQKALAQESAELISECQKSAKQAKKLDAKAKLVSIKRVREGAGISKGDDFKGCKAKVDITQMKVKALLKTKIKDQVAEKTDTFEIIKIGGSYYRLSYYLELVEELGQDVKSSLGGGKIRGVGMDR